MKKIIFILLVIVLGYINPNFNFRSSLLEVFAPFIEFSKTVYLTLGDVSAGIIEINKLREENHDLRNKDFIFVSKDFKERVNQTHTNELEKLKRVVEEDSFFKDRKFEISNILYLDKFNSKLYIKKIGDFKLGEPVTIGRFYIGMISAVNSASYEIDLWNKKDKNLGAFVISSNRENLVVNVRSENYNTSYIENILSTEVVEIGDLVITSSINKEVPNSLYIGVIDRVEGVSSQTFRKALIKKPYDLEKSNYVILLKND